MNRIITIIFLVFTFFSQSQVKTVGFPNIHNYNKSDYNAATQNWAISQDNKGFMYFANNDGILRFDGSQWELVDINIPLPVRSVFVDSKNRIFVGLIDDFGILEADNSGKYKFRSLRPLIKTDIGFSDVWRIHEIGEDIVFQSFEKIIIYNEEKDEKLKIFSPKEKYRFSFTVNNKLIVQDFGEGLLEYRNGKFEIIPWSNEMANVEVLSIIKTESNRLILGTRNTLYKYENEKLKEWNCQANDYINQSKLFTAIPIFGNQLAFGTIRNGLIISDENGNVLQHLNKDNGVQNNTILSLFADKNKNLWLGLDNGIDYVQINSPISYITEGGDIGTGYCCIVHNQNLYLGTNQGLFVKPFDNLSKGKENFKLIKNTEGQVWSLSVKNKVLICGHNFGTFVINGDKATKINNEPGGWKYIILRNNPNIMIGGFYSTLVLFKFNGTSWEYYKKLEGFDESSRFIVEDDDGFLWISHGGKGVFRIDLNVNSNNAISYKLYNMDSGLPSNEDNIVFSFKKEALVSTIDGVYKFVKDSGRFIKTDRISKFIGSDERIKRITEDSEGNLWFIGEKTTGVLRQNEDLTYTKITTPFESITNSFVNEFEFVYPYNDENTFFAIDNGFAHYSSALTKSYNQAFNSFITKIEIHYLDSVIYPGYIKKQTPDEFPFSRNSFRFHFTSPYFENLSEIQFSYFLENYSEDWSNWSSDRYKDFTNLYEGDYVFHVKARNVFGTESNIASYRFIITPPWHRSTTAYYAYTLLAILFIFLGIKYILYRIELSKKKEKLKHINELKRKEEEFQRQSLITEKEIIRLRNDKLRSEKIHRDKELANQTMNLIQKNKFLKKINEELQRIQNSTQDATVVTKLVVIKNRIKKELDDKRQNNLFETYFEDVHADFFKRLKEKHDQLSPGDLRLSAYIRMNISTKEIATLLNITFRGVEIRRYRLRKKMDLSRDINLSTYLSNI